MIRAMNNYRQGSSSSLNASQHSQDEPDASHNRPPIQVQPGEIGPVTDLHENDVLCGRGGRVNGHPGNIQFRKICGAKRDEYFKKGIKKIQKAHIASSVVQHIRSMNPPGRFLKQDGSTGAWFDIGCTKAMTKVGQAIREYTPKIEGNSIGDRANGLLSQQQQRKSSLYAFSGPLYPGYNRVEAPHTSNENENKIDMDASFVRNSMNPMAFHPQERLSTLSEMSGLSRMSCLMRESVQSESTMRMSVLMRQSVLSDMSDCFSAMTLEENGFRSSSSNSTVASIGRMSAFAPGRALSAPADHVMEPQSQEPLKDNVSATCDGEFQAVATSDDDKAPQYGGGSRATRKSSIWSISMASTLSILSISSASLAL